MVDDKNEEVTALQKESEAIKKSADEVVKQTDMVFEKLVSLLEKQRQDLKLKIQTKENEELCRVEALQKMLQKDISKLQEQDEQLEKLSKTEDHNQFLETYLSLPKMNEYKKSLSAPERSFFLDVTVALSSLIDQVQTAVLGEWKNMVAAIKQPDILWTEPQPEAKEDFLKYSHELTMDPNIPNNVMLSCYWEVDWSFGDVRVALSYKNYAFCSSKMFGSNNMSWTLSYNNKKFRIHHNNTETSVPGTISNKLGVYLDHKAGILAFYSDSEEMKLIHKVQTTFTQPLYAGVWLQNNIFPYLVPGSVS